VSGIVGILNLDGSPVNPELLHTITQFLTFAAPMPSGRGAKVPSDSDTTLLHTSPAMPGDEQPANLDGKFWITADARIDARADLIDKLHSKGQHGLAFRSGSPVNPACIIARGALRASNIFLGIFFRDLDGPEQKLSARAITGMKPFYYARGWRHFHFSNTLNCLRLHPGISENLNERAIADFLLFDFNKDMATTAFADIQRLPPAHTLECMGDTLSVRPYWTLSAPSEVKYNRPEEYVEHFNELLDLAVGDRLRTENASVWMSGGLDSSTVAASAQRLFTRAGKSDRRARVTTEVFDRLIPHEERHYAGLVADALGIPNSLLFARMISGFSMYSTILASTGLNRFTRPGKCATASAKRGCRRQSGGATTRLRIRNLPQLTPGRMFPRACEPVQAS